MSKLHIENLCFSFDRTNQNSKPQLIKDFNLTLQKGEICGLVGASGSGKTTILRLIAGLTKPNSGVIKIDDTVVNANDAYVSPEKRGIGFLFQDYGLFPHLTVEKNIAFGLHKHPKAEKKQLVEEMLTLINMNDYKKSYPFQLSGGQQQRVALARSLAPKPHVLLLDEPFSNLDSHIKTVIRNEMKDILKRTNMTVVLSTHDKDDIEQVCDRVSGIL